LVEGLGDKPETNMGKEFAGDGANMEENREGTVTKLVLTMLFGPLNPTLPEVL
jgi:CobQ-like glutamine amidotransferase family enzyme